MHSNAPAPMSLSTESDKLSKMKGLALTLSCARLIWQYWENEIWRLKILTRKELCDSITAFTYLPTFQSLLPAIVTTSRSRIIDIIGLKEILL
jgi:hypothetical protein